MLKNSKVFFAEATQKYVRKLGGKIRFLNVDMNVFFRQPLTAAREPKKGET